MTVFTTFDANYAGSLVVLSNGNLTVTASNAPTSDSNQYVRAGEGKTSGKYYFEATIDLLGANAFLHWLTIGVGGYDMWAPDLNNAGVGYVGNKNFGIAGVRGGLAIGSNGVGVGDNSGDYTLGPNLGTLSTGKRLGFAYDVGARLEWIRLNNGDWNGNPSADPVTGVGGIKFEGNSGSDSQTIGGRVWPAVSVANNLQRATLNFGASAFTDTVPTGYIGWTKTYDFFGNLQYLDNALTFVVPTLWVGPVTPTIDISISTILITALNNQANARGVIYDSDGAGGTPGTLLGSGDIIASPLAPGFDLTFSSPVMLVAGHLYFVGLISDAAVLNQQTLASFSVTGGYINGSGTPTPTAIPATFPSPIAATNNWTPAMEAIGTIVVPSVGTGSIMASIIGKRTAT